MNDTRLGKKDENQQIQVFARVRPMNNAEKNSKSISVIEVPSNKDLVVHERPQDKFSKKFTFDRVFGPTSKQIDVYNAVVSPLLEEVLAGYNCTVFAYGQTGTGKTFTMEGVTNNPALHWKSDTMSGMIPRALSHLFDELRLLEGQEFTVRVSFLELYNEELLDLLSTTDDASKIRLYEDTTKKGAVIIHGLEEVTVHNKSEVYKILEKGSVKRQTAATLMNAHSSRSHTVFSITVHIKENTVDGEELLKTGKLNLVDLAGSENIGRSGAVDRRAREAGSINQSLLTLGRVITALVERAPHIPYRESKLTRLLQESLGGRTKTSIIATVSPAGINLEETLSTLDYAHRAKNITNRPEINQKLSKKALLKEYTEEIERLRRDLLATRERNGVYLAQDSYNEMQTLITVQSKEIEEKINHIKALEETMQNKEQVFNELQLEHIAQRNELHNTKDRLCSVTSALKSTHRQLEVTEVDRDEQKHLVEKHASTEKVLLSQAQTLLSVADTASADTHKLHDKIDRKLQVEQKNDTLGEQFRNNIAERFENVEKDLSAYVEELKEFWVQMRGDIDARTEAECSKIDTAIQKLSLNLTNQHLTASDNLSKNINDSYLHYQNWIQDTTVTANKLTDYEHELITVISKKLAPSVQKLVENEIAENLRVLNSNVSKKLQHVSSYVKETINTVCNYQMEQCARLCTYAKTIKQNMENLTQEQDKMMHKRRLFAKMMDQMSLEFNLLNKTEEEHYPLVVRNYTDVGEMCNSISDDATNNCKTNVQIKQNLELTVQKDLEEIKSDIATATSKNEELANETLKQGNNLSKELEVMVNRCSDGLSQYKDVVQSNAKQMQEKMEEDRNKILVSVNDKHKIVIDASADHAEFMGEQKVVSCSNSAQMNSKVEHQVTDSIDECNKIIERLHETHHEINKFFVEDIQRDIPTGSTPARKAFSYPRQFVVTSPHERILQRFRETRKLVGTSEDDDDLFMNGDITMKQIANSTALSINDLTLTFTPANDDTARNSSTPNGSSLSKHSSSCNSIDSYANIENVSSTLNISTISMPSRVRSESDISMKNDDKENGSKFVKPERTKSLQASKLRKPKRQILGMHNRH